MNPQNRHDRFYIARYKRAIKRRKRISFLKGTKHTRLQPFFGGLDNSFFATREALQEKVLKVKESKSISNQQLREAKETVATQKSKKKYWSFLFLLVNIAVITVILINQTEVQSWTDLVESGANFNYLYLALLGFPLLTLIDWAKIYLLLTRALGRSRHYLSYKVSAIGRYYDFLTPLGTGGQPFQVYYLSKRGVKGQIATSVPLAKYIFSQISFVTIAVIVLLSNIGTPNNNPVVVTAAWVGVVLNLLLLTGVFILSVSKKIGPNLTISVLKLLSKMRIVKNYEVTFAKVMKFVREYQSSMRYFTSNVFVVVCELILSFAYILVQATIPFLIFAAFKGYDPSMWWPIVSKLVMIEFAVSFVPLPGGAGAAEVSFSAMFAALFESSFFWAILIWRFIVYYAFIIQGFIVMIYDMIIGDKKAARLKKIGFWEDFVKKIKFPRRKNRR